MCRSLRVCESMLKEMLAFWWGREWAVWVKTAYAKATAVDVKKGSP